MSMFPVFIMGLIVGLIVSYVYYTYKKDIPSDVKIRAQEHIIKQQNDDNTILENLNKKLYDKIDRLEQELARYKEIENK